MKLEIYKEEKMNIIGNIEYTVFCPRINFNIENVLLLIYTFNWFVDINYNKNKIWMKIQSWVFLILNTWDTTYMSFKRDLCLPFFSGRKFECANLNMGKLTL